MIMTYCASLTLQMIVDFIVGHDIRGGREHLCARVIASLPLDHDATIAVQARYLRARVYMCEKGESPGLTLISACPLMPG